MYLEKPNPDLEKFRGISNLVKLKYRELFDSNESEESVEYEPLSKESREDFSDKWSKEVKPSVKSTEDYDSLEETVERSSEEHHKDPSHKKPGEKCRKHTECPDNYYCSIDASIKKGITERCEPQVGYGKKCVRDAKCLPGLECKWAWHKFHLICQ